MAPLGRPQPSVLHLLVAPQRGQALGRFARHVRAGTRRRREIEQRAIGIEHAGLDTAEWPVRHGLVPVKSGGWKRRAGCGAHCRAQHYTGV